MTAEEELRWYKTHDQYTGCLNTTVLPEFGHALLGKPLVCAVMNVDDFNYYNDVLGHEYGDKVLARVGQALIEHFGENCVFSLGGDEFEVLFVGETEEFLRIHNELEQALRNRYEVEGKRVSLTVSTGYIYGTPQTGEEERQFSRMAARQMFEAKRQGKMRCVGQAYDEDYFYKGNKGKLRVFRSDELDSLTGLLNLIAFRERGRKAIRLAEASEGDNVVLFLNIVNFKRFNEKYGFEEGDALLQRFAQDLQEMFEGDLVARFAEDHFCVVTARDGVENAVEMLRDNLRSNPRHSIVSLHAGAYLLTGGERIIEACDRARIASESIPAHAGECIRFYDEVMDRMLTRQKYIVENLDTALEQGYVQVYLQPVIRAMSGEMCGAEALARWVDPEYGLLPPFAFISTLEENHLIHKLDAYIIREVCRLYRERTDAGEYVIPISFNLSRLDFELCNMVEIVENAVKEFDVPREMVHVEITESILNDDENYIRTGTDELHRLGYQLWMDDFGSGYSSLNVLKEYDFDELKIDMKFLSSFNDKSRKIITSVIDMAKKLGIQTLAEGVETEEQAAFLTQVGCEKLQGYYFGRPEPAAELMDSVARGRFVQESMDTAIYRDEIGKVNLIDEHSMAILEYCPHEFRFLFANDAFRETLKTLGTGSVEQAEENLNSSSFPLTRLFNNYAQKLAVSRGAERLNFVDNGNICTLLGRIVSHRHERIAVQIFLINLSQAKDNQRSTLMDETLRALYTVFDEVYLDDLEDDTEMALFVNGDEESIGRKKQSLKQIYQDYAAKEIHPEDRAAYMAFTDLDTVMERLDHTTKGFMYEYFRTKENGEFVRKLHTIIRNRRDDDHRFIISVRDA